MTNSTDHHCHLWVLTIFFPFSETQLSVTMTRSFFFSCCVVNGGAECKPNLSSALCCLSFGSFTFLTNYLPTTSTHKAECSGPLASPTPSSTTNPSRAAILGCAESMWCSACVAREDGGVELRALLLLPASRRTAGRRGAFWRGTNVWRPLLG